MPEYPRHLPTFDYRGCHRYFLTFCTFNRHDYFVDERNVTLVRDHILRTAAERHFALSAYCFMPDHAHLLVEGIREDAELKPFITRAKQFSGFYFRQQRGRTLWQRYGFERVLRADEDAPSVVKYIIANPVRAGFVVSPTDYPFWGSGIHSREELLEYIGRAG